MPSALSPDLVAPAKFRCINTMCWEWMVQKGSASSLPQPCLVTSDNHSRLRRDLCHFHSAPAQQLSTFLQGTSILDAKAWWFALQIANHGDISPLGAEPEPSSLVRAIGGEIHFVVKLSTEKKARRGWAESVPLAFCMAHRILIFKTAAHHSFQTMSQPLLPVLEWALPIQLPTHTQHLSYASSFPVLRLL